MSSWFSFPVSFVLSLTTYLAPEPVLGPWYSAVVNVQNHSSWKLRTEKWTPALFLDENGHLPPQATDHQSCTGCFGLSLHKEKYIYSLCSLNSTSLHAVNGQTMILSIHQPCCPEIKLRTTVQIQNRKLAIDGFRSQAVLSWAMM